MPISTLKSPSPDLPLRVQGDGRALGDQLGSAGRGGEAKVPEGALQARGRSKDAQLWSHRDRMGVVPDSEIAILAGVSVRTVANYRTLCGIPGYTGPRRPPRPRNGKRSLLDDLHGLMGVIPDRSIAELSGMSLGAVRNYRVKNEIPPSGARSAEEVEAAIAAWRAHEASGRPAEAPAAGGRSAWQVRVAGGACGIVVAADAREAMELAVQVAGAVERVLGVERVGSVLDPS